MRIYKTLDDVPDGMMVVNENVRIIKCSRPLITSRSNPIDRGWIAAAPAALESLKGPFYELDYDTRAAAGSKDPFFASLGL